MQLRQLYKLLPLFMAVIFCALTAQSCAEKPISITNTKSVSNPNEPDAYVVMSRTGKRVALVKVDNNGSATYLPAKNLKPNKKSWALFRLMAALFTVAIGISQLFRKRRAIRRVFGLPVGEVIGAISAMLLVMTQDFAGTMVYVDALTPIEMALLTIQIILSALPISKRHSNTFEDHNPICSR